MELADDVDSGPEINPEKYSPRTLKSEKERRGRLPFVDCLEIGLSLTTALEHLHKHGLAHRDVKPSNIIFINHVPKLADIGLVTGVEATMSFVGTEGFIAPEGPGTAQADLYSLGKVLYEISTGKDRQEFPEPPTLLGEFADRHELLELGEVIKKACATDPSRRYRTAQQMHDDLQLLRAGQSVRRLRTVERRLSLATRAGAIAGVIGLLAVGAYLIAQAQARHAKAASAQEAQLRRKAEASEKKALAEAAKSQQVAQFLKDMLLSIRPGTAAGRDTRLIREMLDTTATRLQKTLSDQPLVKADLLSTLGSVYYQLREYANAEVMHREAFALRRQSLGNNDALVATTLDDLAWAVYQQSNFREAEPLFRQGLELRRNLFSNESLPVADSLSGLGMALAQMGRLAEGEAAQRQALAIARKLNPKDDLLLANALHPLSQVLWLEHKNAEAEPYAVEALAIYRMRARNQHVTNLGGLDALAFIYDDMNRPAEAEPLFREALENNIKMFGNDHNSVAFSLSNLGRSIELQGRWAEAEDLYRQALAMRRRLHGNEHKEVGRCLVFLANALEQQGRHTEAETAAREAILVGEKIQNPVVIDDARRLLGNALVAQQKFAEAEPILMARLDGSPAQNEPAKLDVALADLSHLYEAWGNPVQQAEVEAKRRVSK